MMMKKGAEVTVFGDGSVDCRRIFGGIDQNGTAQAAMLEKQGDEKFMAILLDHFMRFADIADADDLGVDDLDQTCWHRIFIFAVKAQNGSGGRFPLPLGRPPASEASSGDYGSVSGGPDAFQ